MPERLDAEELADWRDAVYQLAVVTVGIGSGPW
jgi:hypothetical protein